jgi:peptidoglycan/LPS O-acetylase OafA/YrhL
MVKRVYYLDFIRGISVCLIIIFHFNVHTLELSVSDNPVFWKKTVIDHSLLGVLGISLFIILSGASLMLSTKESFKMRTFFRNRFLSIYPLFWVTYATAFSILCFVHHKLPAKAPPLSFFLTIIGLDGFLLYTIPNFYLLGEWFLGFIIIMYIIFPLLRYIFTKYAMFTIILCVFITLLVGKFTQLKMDIMRFPLFRLTEFVFGMSFIGSFSD